MKRSRFTEEQILFALKQVAAGQQVADVCRQMGISEATFYVWKKRYGNLGLLEIRAPAAAGRERPAEAIGGRSDAGSAHPSGSRQKKDLTTSKRRDIARWIRDCFQLSVRRSCSLIRLRNATWYYRSQARDSGALRQRLRELATARPRFGYERLHILLIREGWRVGRNRVHRLYKLEA